MDNIIYHKPNHVSNTFSTNVKAGIINPLDRNTYKQLININTRFRKNYTITPASDFGFNLPSTLKKVVSMKVSCLNLPHTIYTVSEDDGSNYFFVGKESNGIKRKIVISSGSYTPARILIAINNALNNISPSLNINLTYNIDTGLMTFNTTDLSNNFFLDFNYYDLSNCPNTFSKTGSNIYKDQLTLGWLLGFRKNYKYSTPQETISNCKLSTRYLDDINFVYSGEKSYTGEALYNSHGNRYFLLSVNDFQNNHNISVVSPLQEETLGDGNILAKSSSNCCGGCGMEAPTRIYFGPTDISKLHIKLYDEFGRIVNMNNSDYSITIEVEILYDL